jgi:hypothetical protein
MFPVDETKGEDMESRALHTNGSKEYEEINKLRTVDSRDDDAVPPSIIFNTSGVENVTIIDDEKGTSRLNTSHFNRRQKKELVYAGANNGLTDPTKGNLLLS